jgi:hypothetical protein
MAAAFGVTGSSSLHRRCPLKQCTPRSMARIGWRASTGGPFEGPGAIPAPQGLEEPQGRGNLFVLDWGIRPRRLVGIRVGAGSNGARMFLLFLPAASWSAAHWPAASSPLRRLPAAWVAPARNSTHLGAHPDLLVSSMLSPREFPSVAYFAYVSSKSTGSVMQNPCTFGSQRLEQR